VVHIIGIDRNDPEGLKRYLGDRDESSLHGTGAVDHVAFFTTGLAAHAGHAAASVGLEGASARCRCWACTSCSSTTPTAWSSS
jgi:hypothetical protein